MAYRDLYDDEPSVPNATTLTITKDGEIFTVDNKKMPGSPGVGRGASMLEAIGSYFHVNQTNLNISFVVDPSAQLVEEQRRVTELKKR